MSKTSKGKRSTNEALSNGHDLKKAKGGGNGFKFKFNPDLTDTVLKTEFRKVWNDSARTDDWKRAGSDVTLIKEPFNCCLMKNVISGQQQELEELKSELEDQDFLEKNNDLYKFVQSPELRGCSDSKVESLRDFFLSSVKPWLEEATGIPLKDGSIDMFCAKYSHTDHLLCHDDELMGRRIAYIMYFTPPGWTTEDGGTLDLFSVDENGCPKEVKCSLVPSFNSIAFFEVTPVSFHQVAEVLSPEKTRLSVGGWFHSAGPDLDRPPKFLEPKPEALGPLDIEEDDFFEWVNPQYLDPTTQVEIQSHFEENSEISLPDFLSPEKFEAVSQALAATTAWKTAGPSDRRCYDVMDDEADGSSSGDDVIAKCGRLLQSDAFCLMLSGMTGLKLHPLAPDDSSASEDEGQEQPTTSASNGDDAKKTKGSESGSNPRSRLEVRRWRRGCYTLLHDNDREQEFSLDARMFFNCGGWSLSCGGYSSYIAKGEDEELLTSSPEPNTLALVYKDKDTLRFVKYVNDEVEDALSQGQFHDLSVTYYE